MRKMIALASVVMLMAVFKTTAYAFPSVVTETWRSNFTKGEVPDDDQPEMVEKLTDLFLEPVTQEEEEEEQSLSTPTDIALTSSDDEEMEDAELEDVELEDTEVIDLISSGGIVIGIVEITSAEEDTAAEADPPAEVDTPVADTDELITTPDEAEHVELIATPDEVQETVSGTEEHEE